MRGGELEILDMKVVKDFSNYFFINYVMIHVNNNDVFADLITICNILSDIMICNNFSICIYIYVYF